MELAKQNSLKNPVTTWVSFSAAISNTDLKEARGLEIVSESEWTSNLEQTEQMVYSHWKCFESFWKSGWFA